MPTADELLKQHALKRTPVRVGVLKILEAAAAPLDAADVLKQLPEQTEPVTVYRTLNTFTEKKIVHRVRGEDRSWRYALGSITGDRKSTADHQHAHFVCDECGTVECVDDIKIPTKALTAVPPAPGYQINYPEVLLHGTCPKCK